MDLRASFQIWFRVLSYPGEAVFADEEERPYATLATAVIWFVGAGLFSVLIWMLVFLLLDPMTQSLTITREMLAESNIPQVVIDDTISQMEAAAGASMALILCGLLVGIPVGGLLWSGLLWLLARALGGHGRYGSQTFLLAAGTAPVVMLSAVLYLVPLLGLFIVLALNGYNVYLTYYAMRVAHRMSAGRTAAVVIAPVAGALLCTGCVLTIWVLMLGAALSALAG